MENRDVSICSSKPSQAALQSSYFVQRAQKTTADRKEPTDREQQGNLPGWVTVKLAWKQWEQQVAVTEPGSACADLNSVSVHLLQQLKAATCSSEICISELRCFGKRRSQHSLTLDAVTKHKSIAFPVVLDFRVSNQLRPILCITCPMGWRIRQLLGNQTHAVVNITYTHKNERSLRSCWCQGLLVFPMENFRFSSNAVIITLSCHHANRLANLGTELNNLWHNLNM